MSDLDPSDEPIHIRDPATPARRKAGSCESVAFWGAMILIGIAVGSYAIMTSYRTETPSASAAPKVVVADPEPPPRPKPAATPMRTRPVAPSARSAAAVVVVHHVEPERKFVDPIERFDSGEAFDNPTSPGRYGRRASGLLKRSLAPARPNQPDPSFGRTPQ